MYSSLLLCTYAYHVTFMVSSVEQQLVASNAMRSSSHVLQCRLSMSCMFPLMSSSWSTSSYRTKDNDVITPLACAKLNMHWLTGTNDLALFQTHFKNRSCSFISISNQFRILILSKLHRYFHSTSHVHLDEQKLTRPIQWVLVLL